MSRHSLLAAALLTIVLVRPASSESGRTEVDDLRARFLAHAGCRLVFARDELPHGTYYDSLPELAEPGQLEAARVALREVKRLPAGFLGKIGLKGIGIFRACVSSTGDGFRQYDEVLKGYRYYGVWNGSDGIAAACYSPEQLALTFHHEVFHCVDFVSRGDVLRRDPRFERAIAGDEPYPALRLPARTVSRLKGSGRRAVLEEAVSNYARKNVGEDKAETARYVLTNLPDALVQAATLPELPGSQRILHVLQTYAMASPDAPADLDWFTEVALVEEQASQPVSRADDLAAQISDLSARRLQDEARAAQLRGILKRAALLPAGEVTGELAQAAAVATRVMLEGRVRPAGGAYVVHGREDETGANVTLRSDLALFANDARLLREIADRTPPTRMEVARIQLANLATLAHYYAHIARQWAVTRETRSLFDAAWKEMVAGLPEQPKELRESLTSMSITQGAERLTRDGELRPAAETTTRSGTGARSRSSAALPSNRYLRKVDAAIADDQSRSAIRAAQPACVRVNGASGVNVSAQGLVLTNAHVAGRHGATMIVEFPDDRRYRASCVAIDDQLDLALCKLEEVKAELPFAELAPEPPEVGATVICVGQPGTRTPAGKPTGYQPWHVSVGKVRGLLPDPLGKQTLGRCKHDAWTYWGHSGSPLFDDRGRIVALHNSWDSSTAMRHAVTHEAIQHFLREEGLLGE